MTSKEIKSIDSILRMIPGYDPFKDSSGFTFEHQKAKNALDFFQEHLVFIEGEKAGMPFHLENWQKCIIANLFGWVNDKGFRRYRESFIEVPRKNGKTPLTAGLVLLTGFCDGEPGAQIYSAAGDREQASLILRHAVGMIERNPSLAAKSRIFKSWKSIEFYGGDAIYKALSAESDTKHGLNAHCVIIDELHVQPNRELVDTLITATGSRRQPLIVHITTAGYDKHSICFEKYDYACKVRDGVIKDPSFLPVIYEALPEDDWTSPKTWKKANPNLGVSISMEYLERECKRAKESPAYENTFKRLHLNLWTEQETRFINSEQWSKCAGVFAEDDLRGLPCFAGLDLSTVDDITSLAMVFLKDKKFYSMNRFWIPAGNARKRENRDRVPYSVWAREGHLKMTEGDVIDYEVVMADIRKDFERFGIDTIAFDRWNFEAIRQRLIYVGVPESKMLAFGQGFASMSAPTKDLSKLILSKEITHNNNPVLNWMASNVSVKSDPAGNLKPVKPDNHAASRIDGIVALIMALGVAITKIPTSDSVYEKRGVLTF